MLQFPDLIVASVWFWTFAELAVGLALIFGLLTRFAALRQHRPQRLADADLRLDGLDLPRRMDDGGLGRRHEQRGVPRRWRRLVARPPLRRHGLGVAPSLDRLAVQRPVADGGHARVRPLLAVAAIVFTVGSYNMLFGAVVSPLHARVTFHHHHIALSNVTLAADGAVTFRAYVDAGPDTGAAYVIAARLVDATGAVAAQWDGTALAALPEAAFDNAYPYAWAARFKAATLGFSAVTGARAPSRCRHRPAPTSRLARNTHSCWKPSTARKWQAAVAGGGRKTN